MGQCFLELKKATRQICAERSGKGSTDGAGSEL